MRFMILMIPSVYQKPTDPNFMPPADMVEQMMKYNEELAKAGVLLALDGLHPPEKGSRISFAGGAPTVKDGPFTDATGVLGGYWMIRVKSKTEAVEWAKRIPALEGDLIEVRQVQEMSDFPTEIQDLIPVDLQKLGETQADGARSDE
ncbi:MAG: YciI family protein [Gemmatimonadota bacterium]